jgi:hypothetical protein
MRKTIEIAINEDGTYSIVSMFDYKVFALCDTMRTAIITARCIARACGYKFVW